MKLLFRNLLFALTLILSGSLSGSSQSKTDHAKLTKEIDSLFAPRNNMKTPGACVIVMEGEEVIATKQYGAADILHKIPFDDSTVFPIEGFTEQLVVFSAYQLQEIGSLALSESVNKYLKGMGFPDKLKLSHLINHSSGIPSIGSLRLLAGWDYEDPFTNEDFHALTKIVSSGIDPDKAYNHIHAGISILMMVIEKATEIPFSEYARRSIFEPLSMGNSFVKEGVLLKNRNHTIAYTLSDEQYVEVVPTKYEVMCPNTYTTAADFLKWMTIVQNKKFHGKIIEQMDLPLTIDGKLEERSYGSYCKGQLQYRHYLGQDEFFRRETGNGYSWMWLRLSQANVSIFALGNVDTYIGPEVNGIADLMEKYEQVENSSENEAERETPELSEKDLEAFVGNYWNSEYMYSTAISIKDGNLFHTDTDNGFIFAMTPITETLFLTPFGGTVEFTNLGGDDKKMRNIIPNGRFFDYEEYDARPLKQAELDKFNGLYGSEKLKSYYRILSQDGKLILRRSRKSDLVLSPIGINRFRTDEIDFRVVEFSDEKNGIFKLMSISNTAIKDVEFKRM